MEVCGGVWRWGIMDVGECGGDGVRRWEMEEFGSRGVKVREVEVKECGGDRVWRWSTDTLTQHTDTPTH